jgi:[NiFe] hydrogenase diaphorase moiety large subunit
MVGQESFERTVCYDDLATGGSMMVFNARRNVVKIAKKFLEFFIEESCGHCTPCRVGNVLLMERIENILEGKGEKGDLEYLRQLGETVKTASRCGLGQTSPNPVLTTMENFRSVYEELIPEHTVAEEGFQPSFDLKASLKQAEEAAGRESVHS